MKAKQEVLIINTLGRSLRSAADGWTYENPANVVDGPIGKSPSGMSNTHWAYDCPLRALADGWKLLVLPKFIHTIGQEDVYEWWFVRDLEN